MLRIDYNDAELQASLVRLGALLGNLTPVMQDLGEFLVASTKDRFPAGTAPDGTPWAPKSPTTLEAYRRRGDPADPRPLFGPTGSLSRGIFAQADAGSVEWGSAMIYARVMQEGAARGAFGATSRGAPIPWGDIPARPFLGLSDDDESALIAIVEEWLDRAAAAPGGTGA
ncbi:MAG: phage virion morphogenesis protein [Alphaproteobacteria bacterium HGW-Alphaproteobacteria-2]|nr:MAG: phage virion morphogenesis protein [Alphaproteobacteria bacterium HGW-Alphaproteobacteria-2]